MRRLLVSAALLAACCAAPAGASTTLGSVDPAAPNSCSAATVFWNFQSLDPSHTVASAGIITSYTLAGTGNAGKKAQLFLLHATTSTPTDPWTVKGKSPQVTLAGNSTETFAVQINAVPGDVIAVGAVDTLFHCVANTVAGDTALAGNGTNSPVGGTVIYSSSGPSDRINISATLEADADGDGFGDDTQDSCPNDPAIHAGPCAADLTLSAAVAPAAPFTGGMAAIAFTVKDAGAPATGVVIRPSLPPGLKLVGSYPACPDGCPVGRLENGATSSVVLLVSADQPGKYDVPATVASALLESNPADNSAIASLTFASSLGRFPACTVPSLKGLPKAFAKRVLVAAGCRLGKATKKKATPGKRGTVIRQGTKAKTVLPFGSKVNVTLRK
jgi:hypothetical protein